MKNEKFVKTKTPIDDGGTAQYDIARRVLQLSAVKRFFEDANFDDALFLLIHLPTSRNFTSIYSYSCAEYNMYCKFYRGIEYLDGMNGRMQLRHVSETVARKLENEGYEYSHLGTL